jgi:2-polyprenyl-3-methyl-5-hydroxy-6-metoxy-1,4-benzoquinol methylase
MEKEFQFKPIDIEGEDTLMAIAAADKFNNWMFQTIRPFSKGNILEIGSGIGNISSFFLQANFCITLSDIRDNYCEMLESQFSRFDNCKAVINIDLVAPDFEYKYAHLLGTFDTVFALNVVEHIFDDQLAIINCNKLLAPKGHVIILVPAYNFLYNKFDKELEHYRRYSSAMLSAILAPSFTIIHRQFFNFMGIFGWFFSGQILKKKTIPKGQMKLYNKLVPIFKIIDKLVFNKVGLSVIQVGQKQ